MRHTNPERAITSHHAYRGINPANVHCLQAPLALRAGSKSRKPSGGGWTFVPADTKTETK